MMEQKSGRFWEVLSFLGMWMLALVWIAPLFYAVWTAVHPAAFETRFVLTAPLTLDNFSKAWVQAPFGRYFLNSFILVTSILLAQLVLCALAAFGFARFSFPGKGFLFALVLIQLTIVPDVLLVENYHTMKNLSLVDTIAAIGLPYMASGFFIFLLRQTFLTLPKELDEAARMEGCSWLGLLWRVYLPLSRPTIVAFGLVSVSAHWNNYIWPLIITNSVETRPLTVGLSIFSMADSGVEWSVINAATLMTSAPLLLGFLLFQRQFVQSFMRTGIK